MKAAETANDGITHDLITLLNTQYLTPFDRNDIYMLAIQIDGNWVAVSRSGVGAADPVPDWLSSHKSFDLQTIRQGRAYALIPKSGAQARDSGPRVSPWARSRSRCIVHAAASDRCPRRVSFVRP